MEEFGEQNPFEEVAFARVQVCVGWDREIRGNPRPRFVEVRVGPQHFDAEKRAVSGGGGSFGHDASYVVIAWCEASRLRRGLG